MHLLIHHGNDRVGVSAAAGALDEVLLAAGVPLERRCGGDGSCGGCGVVLEAGRFSVEGRAVAASPEAPLQALACRTAAGDGEGVVRVPLRPSVASAAAIDDEFVLPPHLRLDPPVRRVAVAFAPAGFEERRSEDERMADAARQALGTHAVEVTLAACRRLARLREQGHSELVAELMVRGERWELVDVAAPGDGAGPALYGVALDIGTTTVAGLLVDLRQGHVVGKSARYNQQIVIAADVASRISAARTEADVRRLQRLLVHDTLQPIVRELCAAHGLAPETIRRFSVAGNTVMTHLLLGLPVRALGRVPFRPLVRQPAPVSALQLGLRAHPQALVDVAPAVAAYIGGDIVADLVACDLQAQPDGTLLIDIGTNAEMVLRDGATLAGCATPAGPAFEGGGLLHGCRAATGAIAHFGADLQPEVIDGGAALGVCGSAVIDFLAVGRRAGWIDAAGRFDLQWLRSTGRHAEVETHGRTSHACVVAEGAQARILISEADVAEILQAKAAVAAGWRTLLALRGRAVEDVPKVVLAGGFARRMSLPHAIAIGLLPPLPQERFEVIGNGALAGACMALIDRGTTARMARLRMQPQVVELNLVPEFEACFIDNLLLPEQVALALPQAEGVTP